MFRVFRIMIVPLLLTAGACAYTDAVPIIDGTERGFAYPTCYPFLKVNGAEMSLLMVPNPNKQRAAQFGAFLAKNNLDVTFGNCGPQNLKADMDSTTVPVELFKLLTEAQKAGALFSKEESAASVGRVIQLFEFEFDRQGAFVGLRPLIHPHHLILIPGPAAIADAAASTAPTNPPANSSKLPDPLKQGGKLSK